MDHGVLDAAVTDPVLGDAEVSAGPVYLSATALRLEGLLEQRIAFVVRRVLAEAMDILPRPPGWPLRLGEMIVAIAESRGFTAGMDVAAFRDDARTLRAMLCNISVVGKTARHAPVAGVARCAAMPFAPCAKGATASCTATRRSMRTSSGRWCGPSPRPVLQALEGLARRPR